MIKILVNVRIRIIYEEKGGCAETDFVFDDVRFFICFVPGEGHLVVSIINLLK